jgi:hypothetical protein
MTGGHPHSAQVVGIHVSIADDVNVWNRCKLFVCKFEKTTLEIACDSVVSDRTRQALLEEFFMQAGAARTVAT